MLLQRFHITILLQALFVLCTLVSCIDDGLSENLGCTSNEETYYLGIKLKFDTDASPVTRAEGDGPEDTEFVPGTDEEQEIALTAKNFVILFKKNSKGVDELLGIFDFWDTEQNPDIGEDEQGKYPPSAETKYTYVARISAQEVKNWSGSALVVLNGKDKIYDMLKKEFKDRTIDATSTNAATLDDVLNAMWNEKDVAEDSRDIGYADKNHRFFTMTNSVYYDKEHKLHVAEEFNAEDYVKKTYAQAKRDPITVYVERMVAKFEFRLTNGNRIFYPSETETDKNPDMIVFDGMFNLDGSPKYTARRWRVEVTGWNTNAFETQSYIFKKLQKYEDLEKLKDLDWDDPDNYRTNWCEDPHYDRDEEGNLWDYSWQYRQSYDFDLEHYFGEEYENQLRLRNYSFDDLGLGKPNKKSDGSDFKGADELADYLSKTFEDKIVYTPENTYDAKAVLKSGGYPGLDSRDELLAGTHLLVGAEFQMEYSDCQCEESDCQCEEYFVNDDLGDSTWRVPKHLFRDRVGYFYLSERECMASLVHDFNQLLASHDEMIFTHYKDWSNSNSGTEKLVADTKGEYSLYYKDDNEDWKKLTEHVLLDKHGEAVFHDIFCGDDMAMPMAELRKSDGKRLPWIGELMDEGRLAILNADGKPLAIYGAKESEDEYEDIIVADKNDDKGTTENVNFIKSLLYDWLGAIDHFNQGRMYYPHGIVNNPPIEEGKTLHYGVVRNNWYRFTLKDVKAIGIPVDKTGQPIVPERTGTEDKVNIKVEILNWHVEESTANVLQ